MDGQRALIPLKTGRHRRPISPWASAERIRVALTEPQKGPGTKGGLPLEDVAERPEKGPAAPGCPGEAAPVGAPGLHRLRTEHRPGGQSRDGEDPPGRGPGAEGLSAGP